MARRSQQLSCGEGDGKCNSKFELKCGVWLRLKGRASCKKVNEIIKSRMQITRAFKGKAVTDAAGEVMMLRIVSKFLSVFELSSFSMS